MKVAIIGASGRMGQALIAALYEHPNATLASAIVRPGHASVGESIPGFDQTYRDDIAHALEGIDVAIDFATPDGLQARANACGATGTPWLLGTTGLSEAQEATVVNTARLAPVLFSANTSLAVNGMLDALSQLATVLGEDYDVDILDVHHRGKIDAPSGTALELGRAVARGWGLDLREVQVVPEARGERGRPSIAFSDMRAGSHAGEHRVLFSGADDSIEIVHRVRERGVFARGALRAAEWLATREGGLYDMADFLGALRTAGDSEEAS
ncbi:MAG: 4-hydroxy-tetrahydrodipicolinate reductase [Pseudomonadota bacterium]